MARRKPDEIIEHPDGTRELIRYRRQQNEFDDQARMRYLLDADGNVLRVWHEVLDRQGRIVHQDEKQIRGREWR